jgi:hypothetical protein
LLGVLTESWVLVILKKLLLESKMERTDILVPKSFRLNSDPSIWTNGGYQHL